MKYTLLLFLASSLVLHIINAHTGSTKQNLVNLLNPKLHHSGRRPISLPIHARQNLTTALLIILLSSDIETNPGPKTANVFPCGLCERPVTWSTEGVCCDCCSIWHHRSCIELCTTDYELLQRSSVQWMCCKCDSLNVSSFTYHAYEIENISYYEPLTTDLSFMDSFSSSFSPLVTSSPKDKSITKNRSVVNSTRNSERFKYIQPKCVIQTLLLLSGQVEYNPGPYTPKYPCMICTKAVKWGQHALACDKCDKWVHTSCISMSTPEYNLLANTSTTWICSACNTPNHTRIFDSILADDNIYDSFDLLTSQSQNNTTISSSHSVIGSPQAPPLQRRALRPSLKPKHKLRTLERQRRLSWRSITCNKKRLVCTPAKQARIQSYAVKRIIQRAKSTIISAFYRPPNCTSEEKTRNIVDQLSQIRLDNPKSEFWIAGDFNLPDIDWSSLSITSHQYPARMSSEYLELATRCGVEQIVKTPTRGENILDLFFTSHPSLVNKCKTIPGVGDHDAVLIDTLAKPQRAKPTKRKIYLWDKANLQSLKADVTLFVSDFVSQPPHNMNTCWTSFRDKVLTLMDKHIPHKLTRSRYTNPWMNTDTRRLARRKDRAFKKQMPLRALETFAERRQEYCGKLPSCVSNSNLLQSDGAHTPLEDNGTSRKTLHFNTSPTWIPHKTLM
ncbi:Hypothetical predicted protein [Mytilus galloprovincialis]|uniref:PHD-type domain-containing protein n=1 Tax=Mytilus galloprovincialis TaxID=29158 RepID=A0A8B6EGL4_MYTGA|nr:Hypothetical predicted protein [Mytilus galloprovincialis]